MGKVYSFLKKVALTCLPEPVLQSAKKVHHVRELKSFSLDDEPDLKVVKYLLDEGDSVLDVGANVGIFTNILSKYVGPSGNIYSLEPVPATFEVLSSNIEKLKLNNVKAMNFAVSDKADVLYMEIPSYEEGGENFYMAHIVDKTKVSDGLKHVEVKAVTLDDQFGDLIEKIKFIKSDVEGHELECLLGSRKFIQKGVASWLIEVSGDPDVQNSSAANVFDMMQNANYSAWWLNGKNLVPRKSGDKSTNYFFLNANHLDMLRIKNPQMVFH